MDQFPTFLLWIVSTTLAIGAAYRMGLRHMAAEVDDRERHLRNAARMMTEMGREFADMKNERDYKAWQARDLCRQLGDLEKRYRRLRQAVKDGEGWKYLED